MEIWNRGSLLNGCRDGEMTVVVARGRDMALMTKSTVK
jgi:hypothetical protein